MSQQIERDRVLLFLRDWFGGWKMKGAPTNRLGKTFVETFNVPVPSQNGLEVFGYSPEEALFREENDLDAVELILSEFTCRT